MALQGCFPGIPWLAVFLATMSKFSISVSLFALFIYSGELFPTVIRGFALSMTGTMSQIGLITTPKILFLVNIITEDHWKSSRKYQVECRFISSCQDDILSSCDCSQGTLYGEKIPFVVFGVLAVLSSLLMLTLPETANAPLPSTMQEAEDYTSFVREKMKSRVPREVPVLGKDLPE